MSSNLGQILLTADLINFEQLKIAEQLAEQQQQRLLTVLIAQEMVTADNICTACANYYQLPKIELMTINLQQLPQQYIDTQLCKLHLILPVTIVGECLQIALCDPDDLSLLEDLQFRTGLIPQPAFANYNELTYLINAYLNQLHLTNHSPVITIVEQILTDAILQRASDIHCEPTRDQLCIRLRIDGLLHTVANLSAPQVKPIISRFKIMGNLDITEQRKPQDGRFTFKSKQGHICDCQLSTCPTLLGEKLVIRLLMNNQQLLNIDELGLTTHIKKYMLNALSQPQGLLLVTGPTGSGKTQTLYTALQLLNQEYRNIVTIEDPVEIQLPGINQVRMNEKIGLTFAAALRAFLRQDPDVIMIGEIRDSATAETAIRAAQTGHLVLSTLHTNSAGDTLKRLISMGIHQDHLAGALTLVVAQRLARRLCKECKEVYELSTEKWRLLNPCKQELTESTIKLFRSKGCAYCLGGYKGRCGIFEAIPFTTAYSQTVTSLIQENNTDTLWQAALDKVAEGITSLQEVYRVIKHE